MSARGLLALAVLLGSLPRPVIAQTGQIEPDRPDITNSARLVAPGRFQVELGGLFTHEEAGAHALGTPVSLRIGFARWIEGRIETNGFVSQSLDHERSSGFGDISLGAKVRLIGDARGDGVLSVLPAIGLPTASREKGLGSGDTDIRLTALSGRGLGERGHVDVNYGIGAIGAGGGRRHFAQHLLSVSASVEAGGHASPYGEIYWISREDPDGGRDVAIDFGVIRTIASHFAFDGGVLFGLSHAAAGFAVFGGLSFAIDRGAAPPRHHGEHGVTSVFRQDRDRD